MSEQPQLQPGVLGAVSGLGNSLIGAFPAMVIVIQSLIPPIV
jgi:hypothetical protein